jgi:hypothetical protein
MADAKISALTANTTPALTDIIPMVDDPSGTPVTQKITLENLLKVFGSLTEDTAPSASTDFLLEYDTSASGVKARIVDTAGELQNHSNRIKQ